MVFFQTNALLAVKSEVPAAALGDRITSAPESAHVLTAMNSSKTKVNRELGREAVRLAVLTPEPLSATLFQTSVNPFRPSLLQKSS